MTTIDNTDQEETYPFEATEEYVDNENSLEARKEITEEALSIHTATNKRFWQFTYLTGAMLLLGVIGFLMKIFSGFDDKQAWGYYVAVFAFLMTTTSAAPMVAIAPRIANAQWRRPISRAAEIWTLAGSVNLILYIPLIWLLPSLANGRRSLWFYEQQEGVPPYSPHVWATLAIIGLVVLGLALTWVSCLPDFALLSLLTVLIMSWRS